MGYGGIGKINYLWKYKSQSLIVFNSETISQIQMKLLVLSNYFKGNSVSNERQNDDFHNTLSTISESSPLASLLLGMPLTSINTAYGMIMTLLTDTSISDLSGSSYTLSEYISNNSDPISSFLSASGADTNSDILSLNTDEFGNPIVETDGTSLYFDLSGNSTKDVILVKSIETDTSGNINIYDNNGDNYTLSQFHTLVTSTSYDLSENIYTYNLSNSFDSSGNTIDSITGSKLYDPDDNLYLESGNISLFTTTLDVSGTASYSFDLGLDSSGNALYSFFDLYTISQSDQNDTLGIDYTDINSEYNTLVTRLNSLIEDLLLAEDSINDDYSNGFKSLLNMIQTIDQDNYFTNITLMNSLIDSGDYTESGIDIYIKDYLSSINTYYYTTVSNLYDAYNFYLTFGALFADSNGDIWKDSDENSLFDGVNSYSSLISTIFNGMTQGDYTINYTEAQEERDTEMWVMIGIAIAVIVLTAVTFGVGAGIAGAAAGAAVGVFGALSATSVISTSISIATVAIESSVVTFTATGTLGLVFITSLTTISTLVVTDTIYMGVTFSNWYSS